MRFVLFAVDAAFAACLVDHADQELCKISISPLRAAIGGAWLRTASSTRRDKSLVESYSVLRKTVSHAALCSTSRRGRAALSTSVVEDTAQAADHHRRPQRDKAADIIALL